MQDRLSILISSCDKFSDLWDENIKAFKRYWKDNPCETYLVTDAKTEWFNSIVKVIVAEGENNFPLRIKYALDSITTPYVLVTLDDYFLIRHVDNEKISYLLDRMENEKIQYLSLYNRRITKESKYKPLKELTPIDLTRKYAITLYPAIWNVNFLKKTVKDNLSPWLYEVSLTKTAVEENANCQASLAGVYDILDVVRKGKVLHKAKRYFRKHNIEIGNRPCISYGVEAKLLILDVISWYTPRKMFITIKNIARKFGMTFYSED
jgi:hypothetical protein